MLSSSSETDTEIPNLVIILWFQMGDFISNYHMWSWDVRHTVPDKSFRSPLMTYSTYTELYTA